MYHYFTDGCAGWVENVFDSSRLNQIDMNHMNQLKFVATF